MVNHAIIYSATAQQWWHFHTPQQILTTSRQDEVISTLAEIEYLTQRQGLYAVGFISYEAAAAFDPALKTHAPTAFPLIWFGLYDSPSPQLPSPRPSPKGRGSLPQLLPLPLGEGRGEGNWGEGNWQPSISAAAYHEAIQQIKHYIERGDTYQVNYTFRLQKPFTGEPYAFFQQLIQAQPTDYAAYLETESWAIASASPELFFQLAGNHLTCRPMKGTAARGRFLAEDNAQAQWLQHSIKNRAENVMIVDMMRNDLGRIAEVGSVRVPQLFSLERYPTVWQMTSTVTAETQASLVEIMAALFPCASITGAPKARTMQIITELETSPRRIYTGCIGFIAPHRQAQFNVAIRTILLDKVTNQAEYGVGGGIVWDSDSHEEFAECSHKAKILTMPPLPHFSLLETMLWTPAEGYFLLQYHLQRLTNSAAYFDIPLNLAEIATALAELVLPPMPHKIRLLVAQDGMPTYQAVSLSASQPVSAPLRVTLAKESVNSANRWLYHKTTQRQVYETARAQQPEGDEVILWNERGEVTEGTITNVIIRWQGELITPALTCGLLPGTMRAWLIEQGQIREAIITQDMFRQAAEIYLINSVRKWQTAELV